MTAKEIDDARDKGAAAVMGALIEAGALDGSARAIEMTQLEGGWSRESHLLKALSGDGAEREFVVRVKRLGALLDTSLRQEFEASRLAATHGVTAPFPHVLEADVDNPLGGPFYVMDRASGSSPNVWRGQERKKLEDNWRQGGTLAEDLVDSLVRIHSIPADSVAEVLPSRDLEQATRHWLAIQSEMALVRDPVVEDAYAWLLDQDFEPSRPTMVHGDYRIGNCLVRQGRITAILDGYVSLAYHAGKFTLPGSQLLNALADRDWFFGEYERRSGRAVDLEAIRAFSVLGILMLIAILTTGIRMYADGRSEDVRMVWGRFAIPGLRQDLTALMDY